MSFKTAFVSVAALLFIAPGNCVTNPTQNSIQNSTQLAATCSPDTNYFDYTNCERGCQCFSRFTAPGSSVCMYSFDYTKPCTTDNQCLQYGSYYPICLTARFTGTPGTGYCGSSDPANWYGGRNVACAKGKLAATSIASTVMPTSSVASSKNSTSVLVSASNSTSTGFNVSSSNSSSTSVAASNVTSTSPVVSSLNSSSTSVSVSNTTQTSSLLSSNNSTSILVSASNATANSFNSSSILVSASNTTANSFKSSSILVSASNTASNSSLASSSILSNSSVSASPATPTSLLVSSTNSSASTSPLATPDLLTCVGRDTGATLTYTTSKGTYDITCGADYYGGDFKSLSTDSFDACVAACDEEIGCLTVSFRSGACYLKNQLTDLLSDSTVWAAKNRDAVVKAASAGPSCIDKASDTTTYKSSSGKSYKIICGREYGGGDLTYASTSSFKECIDTCSTTAQCIDVSYVNGACYLKSSKSSLIEADYVWTAELLDSTTTISSVSTSLTSSTASPSPTASTTTAKKELTCLDNKDNKASYTAANGGTYIVECGVDYAGGDLMAVDSSSFSACIDTCDTTKGCVDVSYVWGRCYLKSVLTSSSSVDYVWTGRKTSSNLATTTLTSSSTSAATVTRVTAATTSAASTACVRDPNPTAAVDLDFESGSICPWRVTNSPNFSASIVSPGGDQDGAISNFAARIDKAAGVTTGYSFSELQQMTPEFVTGQTYRIEFSWKYTADTDSDDNCSTFFDFWGVQLANLVPSTTSSMLNSQHIVASISQCGTDTRFWATKQPVQQPGEWRRYTAYYRNTAQGGNYKQLWFGYQCAAGTQKVNQSVFFDNIVITPVAAC